MVQPAKGGQSATPMGTIWPAHEGCVQPLLLWALKILLMKHTILELKNLWVHLDDVLDEIIIGSARRSHGG